MGGTLSRAESRVPSPVLGTAAYVATAVMLFAGFISAYFVLRAGAVSWPPPGQPRLPLAVSGLNTVILLSSGAFVAAGVRRRILWMRWGAALGAAFLAVQGLEWTRMLGYGMTASSGAYGAVFYALVGAHAVHVLGGLVFVGWTAWSAAGGGGRLLAAAVYWSFVVLVWPVLYVLLYLV